MIVSYVEYFHTHSQVKCAIRIDKGVSPIERGREKERKREREKEREQMKAYHYNNHTRKQKKMGGGSLTRTGTDVHEASTVAADRIASKNTVARPAGKVA